MWRGESQVWVPVERGEGDRLGEKGGKSRVETSTGAAKRTKCKQ